MKPPLILVRQINKGRALRNWAVAAVLLTILIMAGTARAVSVTNVIYSDTFNRVGQLVGTAPDTVNVPGAVWCGGYPTNGLVTDGTEASITNAEPIVPPYENAYLPINLETGHVYVVTCTIVGNSNAVNGNLAFGYGIEPGLYTGPQQNANWGIDWVEVNSSNTSCSYWSYGGIRNFQTTYPWTQSMTYSTVLNLLTNYAGGLTNMSGSFYTNGVFAYAAPFVPVGRMTEHGMYPGFVFIGMNQPNTAGSFQNFSVTDIIPNATTPTILEQPNNLTAQVGHTATFWVRGYSAPDPNYQWMTNGVNIPGATNASYTTPALSTAYNGMQYSVQLSTVAGSVTSSSATLTVNAGTPTVYSATKTASQTNIVVMFSGPVDSGTGLNTANYALLANGAPAGVSIIGASAGSVPGSVVLQTSTLNTNTGYYLVVKSVQDQFGDAINTSTNPVLPANLVYYFRADSGVQLDASGNVAQWSDLTTNGNNASQFFGLYPNINGTYLSSVTARPTVNNFGANDLPGISFNGSSDYLTIPASPQMNLNGNLTMYCYASPASSAAQEVMCEDNGNIANAFELQLTATTYSPDLLFGDGNNYGSWNSALAGYSVTALPHVWALTAQMVGTNTTTTSPSVTNSVHSYVDGSPYGIGGGDNIASGGTLGAEYTGRPIYIGGRLDHGAWFNGSMGEIMLFNGPIADADRTNVDNYLGQKYFQFAINNNLPSAVTSSNGFTVTFTIAASQGSLHINYQWQVNGANIPGAPNSPSYTTPPLGPSNNNTTYDVVMTLPNGTTYTSTISTLTVLPEPPYVISVGLPIWEAGGTNSITNLVVVYDVAVSSTSATSTGNYSLNNGASVLSAAIGAEPNKVILTTSPLTWAANPGNYSLTVKNVQDQFNDTIVTASSSVGLYPAGTALWLEGNAGVVIDTGGNPVFPGYTSVNEWDDQSGNGANLYQNSPSVLLTSASLEPLFTTNYHGNLALQFAGTNVVVYQNRTNSTFMSSLNSVANDYPCLEITNDITIFSVATFNTLTGATNGEIVGKTDATVGNKPAPYDFYAGGSAAAPNTTLYRGNGSTIANIASPTSPALGVPHIVGGMQSGNTVTEYIDGAVSGSGIISAGEPYGDQGAPLQIGQRSDRANRLNGQLFELIMISSALDSNDVASIQSYLASKYIVPTGANAYPVITQQPVAVTNVPLNTTLTVPAGVSGNPLALQWFDTNGVAIAGQTSNILVVPNIQASDTYYLVATNIYGSATSSKVVVNAFIPINPNPTNIVFSVSGSQLTLSWPADHTGWTLQAETNSLSVGITNDWVTVSGSTATNQVIVPINLTNGSVFYRLMLP